VHVQRCSNASQKYLVYTNPVVWPSLALNDAEELGALRAALALGRMLGRVVILPRFHCSSVSPAVGDVGGGRQLARRRRRVATAAPPPPPSRECPLNSLLNVTAFDAQFHGAYRESSFLRHPLVPSVVRDDLSPPQDVHRPLRNGTGAAAALLPAKAARLRVDEALRLFGSSPSGVLVFRSLYRVQPRFDGVAEQRAFDSRVLEAFRRGTYRQM